MGDYYGIIGKRALGEVSPCYRKIFSVCSSFHCTGILALGGVAAYYYFKIYKPKKEEEEDDQPEGLETGDLETVEDDEELDDEPEDFEDSEK